MVASLAKLFNVLLVLALSAQTTLAAPARHSHLHNRVVRRDSCGAKQGGKVTIVNDSNGSATPPILGESFDKGDNVVNQGPDPESVIDSDRDDEALDNEYEADPPAPVADITQSYSVIPMPSSTPSPDPQPITPAEQDTPREPVVPPQAESPGVCITPLLPSLSRAITFHQPLSQVLSHTTDAIRVLTANVNAKTGQFNQGGGEFFVWASSNGWTSIAINDRLNGKREFEKDVGAGLQAMADHWVMGGEKWKVPLVNEFNDDSGWAGWRLPRRMMRTEMKSISSGLSFLMAHGYVRQSDIDKGYLEGTKNADVKILKECNGKSLLGGVAWKNTPDGAGLNAVSTGNFALLAAELCRITGDKQKYCDPAVQSMRFLDDHLLAADGLLKDHIISDSCEGKDWKFTYNAGLYIATYASLGATLANPDFIAKSEAMITASLKTPEWNNDLGVIKQGSGKWDVSDDGLGFKSIYVRYLQKVHPWLANQAIKDAIVQYVNIQYDSLVWAASDSTVDPVNFGRSWDGNGGKGYEGSTVHSQIAALDALNAIQLNPPSAFPAQVNGDSVTTSEQGVARC